ncbi:MAG: biotin/lipoyl-binding protein [Chlorobi bacterium]|nr:biotin/lipoyl-binding protein [Chlorobiota bacterium]
MKKYKFTIRGHNYDVEILSIEDNVADIEVNGTKYAVEVHHKIKQSKTPVFLRSRVPSPTRSETKIKKDIRGTVSIKSPLPGNIMQVFVKEGEQVKKGDKLLMYEAMKMENNVLAEKDGTIVSIKVRPGDSVLQDELLIEME